ncbi:MAG: ABC transporter permease [Nocardiopsaceae bacterium]|nr:ABC transporter permease [Nocardiopsaceae bacterium]
MTSPDAAAPPTLATAGGPAPAKVYRLRDITTMLRRNLKQELRDKVAALAIIGIPVLFLLLFVYVFGGALTDSVKLSGAHTYVDYVLPGLIIMTAAAGLIGISTQTSVDMTAGIIDRFRTMAIFRPAILIARIVASALQTLLSIMVVFGIAFGIGFRSSATVPEWLSAAGLLAVITFTLACLGLAFGLAAKSVASASNGPFPLILLPLVGSGIVPTATMPAGLRYFAEYQPFSPMINTLRGLLLGTPIGWNWLIALTWCAGLGLFGLAWSISVFNRRDRNRGVPGLPGAPPQ